MKLREVDYLRLTTPDKHEFIISQNAVLLCPGFIKLVEDAVAAEDRIVSVNIHYPRQVLRAVLDYLHYKMRYLSAPDYAEIPPFPITPSMSLEVFKAARDLDL